MVPVPVLEYGTVHVGYYGSNNFSSNLNSGAGKSPIYFVYVAYIGTYVRWSILKKI